MLTTVTFTANSKAGNLSRLILAVRRLGYKAVEQTLEKSAQDALDLIKMTLESQQTLYETDFANIRTMVPTVVDVTVAQSARAQAANTASKDRQKTVPKKASSTLTINDVSAFVKNEGRKLITAYPDIHGTLRQLEAQVPEANRKEVFSKLGAGIGRWQYKKNFGLGGRLSLDKTVQRSLKLALADFVDVSAFDTTLSVQNCPHCSVERSATTADCYFISNFIEGFIGEMKHLKSARVQQQLSKTLGANSCEFHVSLDIFKKH